MDVLGKLFGSPTKVKIMRLFLLNPEQGFESADVITRTRGSASSVRKDLAGLAAIGFIKKRSFQKQVPVGGKKSGKTRTKRVSGWVFDTSFEYQSALRDLLIDAEFITHNDLIRRFKKSGKIKLLITAGIFTRDPDSRLDLLIVGDNLRRGVLEQTVRSLEAEIGKELAYAVFDSPEFIYRSNMYDKLVRDVIDFPHERVINNGLFEQAAKKV